MLQNDEFIFGHLCRFCGVQKYYDLMEELMTAVKQNYGEKVIVNSISS